MTTLADRSAIVPPWCCPGCSKVHTQTYGIRCQADHCSRCVGHTRGRVVRALVGADVVELFVPAGKEGMGEVHFAHYWWPIVAIRQSCLFDADGTPKIDVDYRDHDGVTRTVACTSWSKTRACQSTASLEAEQEPRLELADAQGALW